MQNKIISLKKSLKEEKIKYKNLKIKNETINFQISENEIKIFEDFFLNKDNSINNYYDQYDKHQGLQIL